MRKYGKQPIIRFAKWAERILYVKAPSRQEYEDKSTLSARVVAAVQEHPTAKLYLKRNIPDENVPAVETAFSLCSVKATIAHTGKKM